MEKNCAKLLTNIILQSSVQEKKTMAAAATTSATTGSVAAASICLPVLLRPILSQVGRQNYLYFKGVSNIRLILKQVGLDGGAKNLRVVELVPCRHRSHQLSGRQFAFLPPYELPANLSELLQFAYKANFAKKSTIVA